MKPDTCNLKRVFWDEVERGLGGRSRRSRGCAGDGESGMARVVHGFDYSVKATGGRKGEQDRDQGRRMERELCGDIIRVMTREVPSLLEWLGGQDALEALITRFYEKVPADPMLQPLFAGMPAEHFKHVSAFIGEVFGGPSAYSEQHGGHANMIRQHLGRHITDAQRKRWVELLVETADEMGVPADPEFRSALMAYLEWGSRLAVINSGQPKDMKVDPAPMPKWGWGVPGGPYQPDSE